MTQQRSPFILIMKRSTTMVTGQGKLFLCFMCVKLKKTALDFVNMFEVQGSELFQICFLVVNSVSQSLPVRK